MRAYQLAIILKDNHEVEIMGPTFGDGIYDILPDDVEITPINSSPILPFPLTLFKKMSQKINSDLIIASKLRISSFGIALYAKKIYDIPVLIDIDEWDLGFRLNKGRAQALMFALPSIIHVNSYVWLKIMEKLLNKADMVTVNNTWLQNRFGGEHIPHVRDDSVWNPELYSKKQARKSLNLDINNKIIMFLGKPLPHKGIQDLIAAFSLIEDNSVYLHIVGTSPNLNDILHQAGQNGRIVTHKKVHFDQAPMWVTAADIMVAPQRSQPSSYGQVPAKIMDSLALGKPLVTTNVGSIPDVVGDAALITNPNDPASLYEEINSLLIDEELSSTLAGRARKRYVDNFSNQILTNDLEEILKRLHI
jgi:glycosyltransferase involved in cell wall biosynthesis